MLQRSQMVDIDGNRLIKCKKNLQKALTTHHIDIGVLVV